MIIPTLTQTVIIILVQDVIMDTAMEVVRVLAQVHIQVGTQIRRLNKLHRGEIIVTRVHLQRLLHPRIAHPLLLLMVVLQAVVHRLAEVHQVVAVEVEVQDNINKILTSKIPSNSTFEGIFSFKV